MPVNISRKNEQRSSGIVLVVVVALLVGIYFIRLTSGKDFINTNIENNLVVWPAKAGTIPVDTGMQVYENSVYNFKIQYPATWAVASTQTGEGENLIFTLSLSEAGQTASLSVMPEDMEGIVRNSVGIAEESEIQVNGATAVKIEATTLKDGSPISLMLIKNNGQLYDIQGTGKMFDQIVSNFILL